MQLLYTTSHLIILVASRIGKSKRIAVERVRGGKVSLGRCHFFRICDSVSITLWQAAIIVVNIFVVRLMGHGLAHAEQILTRPGHGERIAVHIRQSLRSIVRSAGRWTKIENAVKVLAIIVWVVHVAEVAHSVNDIPLSPEHEPRWRILLRWRQSVNAGHRVKVYLRFLRGRHRSRVKTITISIPPSTQYT